MSLFEGLAIVNGTMKSALKQKRSREVSGHQFMTLGSSTLKLCSLTTIQSTPPTSFEWLKEKMVKVLEGPNQSLDLHPIEIQWNDR